MRRATAVVLFLAAALGLLAGGDTQSSAQDKKAQKKAEAKIAPPDEATLKQIAEKTAALRKAVADLKAKMIQDAIVADVEVFLKAAEWIVRHGEWLTNDAGKQTLRVLDIGLERSRHAIDGNAPWQDLNGKWVARGYRSKVDGSVQPYAMLLPDGYGPPSDKTPLDGTTAKRYRLDVVLHGRDGTLTEVKFLNGHEGKAAPKGLDHVLVEVYGRGNNAYRWAGETDVMEATEAAMEASDRRVQVHKNPDAFTSPIQGFVLRGFSMGGAGAWHIGLHHPTGFSAIGPGAGFTSTHGYIANLPKQLPPHVEKCLRIYDAVGYAENVFHVPVVAYSGEKDPQKKAADNIENALKGFKEPVKFTHLVAPGLEHQMPAEWQAKAEAEYRKHVAVARKGPADRVRFVTYTPKYGECEWVRILCLDTMYEKAVVDAMRTDTEVKVTTTNVRQMYLACFSLDKPPAVTIDGQKVEIGQKFFGQLVVEKRDGKWAARRPPPDDPLRKLPHQCGPIDDAFMSAFAVSGPTGAGWHAGPVASAKAQQEEFAKLWDKYFRGELPTKSNGSEHVVLFGDPASNPRIAEVLPKLPITWTKDELLVNGVKYDPKTHLPVLIYPNPLNPRTYVVLNSGHTFKEADLKGTNALLYPRLGDWAVIKPTPTNKDPAGFEVVAAGLFDENWKFSK